MERENHKSNKCNLKSCFNTKSPNKRTSSNQNKKYTSCKRKYIKNNNNKLRQQLYYNNLIQNAHFLQSNDKVNVTIHFNNKFCLNLALPSCMTIFQLNQLISSYTKLHKKYAPTVNHTFSGLYIENKFLSTGSSKNQVWQKNGLQEQTCEHIVEYLRRSLIISSPSKMLSDIAKNINLSEENSVGRDKQFYGKTNISTVQLQLVVKYDSLSQEVHKISSQNEKYCISVRQLEDFQLQKQKIPLRLPQSQNIEPALEQFKEQNILFDEKKSYHRISKGKDVLRKLSMNYQNIDKCKTHMQNQTRKSEKIQKQPVSYMSIIQQANDESFNRTNRTLLCQSPKRASHSKSNIYIKQHTEMNQSPRKKIEKQIHILRKTKNKSDECHVQISQSQNLITFEEDYQTLKNSRKQNGNQISRDTAENQNTALKWLNRAQIIQWLVVKDIITEDKTYKQFTPVTCFYRYQSKLKREKDIFCEIPIRLRGYHEIYSLALINISSKVSSTKQDIQLLIDLIRRLFINPDGYKSHTIKDIFTYTSQNHPDIVPCTVSVVLNHVSLENVPLVSYITNLLTKKLKEESLTKQDTSGLIIQLKLIIQTVAQRMVELFFGLERKQPRQNNKENNQNKKAFQAGILIQLLQITQEGQNLSNLKHCKHKLQRCCDSQGTYFLNLFSLILNYPNGGIQSQTQYEQQSGFFSSAYRWNKFIIGINTLRMMQKLTLIIQQRISQRDHFSNITQIKHKKQAEREHVQKLFKRKGYSKQTRTNMQEAQRIKQQPAHNHIYSKNTQINHKKLLNSLIRRLISQVLSLLNHFTQDNKGVIHKDVLSQIEQTLNKFGISSEFKLNVQGNIVGKKSTFRLDQIQAQSQQNQQLSKESGLLETYLCKSTQKYVERWLKAGLNEQKPSYHSKNTLLYHLRQELNNKKSQLTKIQYF